MKTEDKYWRIMERGCPICKNKWYHRSNGTIVCNNWKCDNYHIRFKWNPEENRLMKGRIDFIEEVEK